MGPANLLFLKPTGRKATMVCYPWDDLESWRLVYPAERFVEQMQEVQYGFMKGVDELMKIHGSRRLLDEFRIMSACEVHFRSAAFQSNFIHVRDWKTANEDEVQRRRRLLRIFLNMERDSAISISNKTRTPALGSKRRTSTTICRST
jgi:hypothetical protein